MGISKTTYHIRNSQSPSSDSKEDDKRLVLIIEDNYNGLNVEKAVLVKAIIEGWLRSNYVKS